MNYQKKYFKYKNKYLNLKNSVGGKILTFNKSENETVKSQIIFPLKSYPGSFYYNNRLIKMNDITGKKFKIDNKMQLLPITTDEINNNLFDDSKFKYLNNESIIINKDNIIPFNILFLQKQFNILGHLNMFIKNNITNNKFYSKIMDRLFNFSDDNYIGIKNSPNILSKYIFINKTLEFLQLIYDDKKFKINSKDYKRITFSIICGCIIDKIKSIDKEDKLYTDLNLEIKNIENLLDNIKKIHKLPYINDNKRKKYNKRISELLLNDIKYIKMCYDILKIHGNKEAFVNLSDTINMYSTYIASNKDDTSKLVETYKKYIDIDKHFFDDLLKIECIKILKYKKFISILNNLSQECKPIFNVDLSHILFSSYIGGLYFQLGLKIGAINELILPINRSNLLENLLNKNILELNSNDFDNKDKINILNSDFNIIFETVEQSEYKKNYFPNCVELVLFNLLKLITYDTVSGKYKSDNLPIINLSKFLPGQFDKRKELETMIDENFNLDIFVNIISNLKNLRNYSDYYVHNNSEYSYELRSNTKFAENILRFILCLSDDTNIFNSSSIFINENSYIKSIDLATHNTIKIIDINDLTIDILFGDGHSAISRVLKDDNIKTFENWYLIYFFTKIEIEINKEEFKIFECNEKLVKLAFMKNGKLLEYADDIIKKNKDLVKIAIKQDGTSIRHAESGLKYDEELALIAVNHNGNSLTFLSDDFKANKNIVLKAVATGNILFMASKELKNDYDVVLAAVKFDGTALEDASEVIQNNKNIVLAAIAQNSNALQFASKNLKDDDEIVKLAVTNIKETLVLQDDGLSSPLQYASIRLQEDYNMVLLAVTHNGRSLQYAPKILRDNYNIVLVAVTHSGISLQYASERLKSDIQICLAALNQDKKSYRYIGDDLKNDAKILANK